MHGIRCRHGTSDLWTGTGTVGGLCVRRSRRTVPGSEPTVTSFAPASAGSTSTAQAVASTSRRPTPRSTPTCLTPMSTWTSTATPVVTRRPTPTLRRSPARGWQCGPCRRPAATPRRQHVHRAVARTAGAKSWRRPGLRAVPAGRRRPPAAGPAPAGRHRAAPPRRTSIRRRRSPRRPPERGRHPASWPWETASQTRARCADAGPAGQPMPAEGRRSRQAPRASAAVTAAASRAAAPGE